jgi:hypothetical protein
MIFASGADMGVSALMRRSLWRGAFSAADLLTGALEPKKSRHKNPCHTLVPMSTVL